MVGENFGCDSPIRGGRRPFSTPVYLESRCEPALKARQDNGGCRKRADWLSPRTNLHIPQRRGRARALRVYMCHGLISFRAYTIASVRECQTLVCPSLPFVSVFNQLCYSILARVSQCACVHACASAFERQASREEFWLMI